MNPSPENFRVVPWYNLDEFQKVCQALFSSEIDDMVWGLQRVEIWKQRCYLSLPSAVDATACLIRAKIEDSLSENQLTVVKHNHLGISLLYSIALTRFVNVMSEMAKPKCDLYVSYSEAADRLGIPRWIVELRHCATHSNLPSLDMLRSGAETAYKWLQENYWEKIPEKITVASLNCTSELRNYSKRDQAIIDEFKKIQFRIVSRVKKRVPKTLDQTLNLILNKVSNYLRVKNSTFLDTLVKQKNFFMSTSEMAKIFSSEDIDFLVYNTSSELPESIVSFWAPVINVINSEQCMQEFVHKIVASLMPMETLYQKIACAWVDKIINITITNGESETSHDPIKLIFEKNNWMLNWFELLQDCVLNPCTFISPILDNVLESNYPPINPKVKLGVCSMFSIYLGLFQPNSQEEIQAIPFTWTNVRHDLELRENSRPHIHGSTWKPAADFTDWENIPLGNVFSPTEDFVGNPPKCIIDVQDNMVIEEIPSKERAISIDLSKTILNKAHPRNQMPLSSSWNQYQVELPLAEEINVTLNEIY